jgi:hypothetical protein
MKIMKSCSLVENSDVSSEEKDASITKVQYKTRHLQRHCWKAKAHFMEDNEVPFKKHDCPVVPTAECYFIDWHINCLFRYHTVYFQVY